MGNCPPFETMEHGGDRDLNSELVAAMRLPLADAFNLGRVQRIRPSAMRDPPSHANDSAAKFIQALDAEREDAWGKLRPLVACVQVHINHGYPCQDANY